MPDTATFDALTATTPPLASSDPRACWQTATLPDLAAAEELLDELENAGYTHLRLSLVRGQYVVRWRA